MFGTRPSRTIRTIVDQDSDPTSKWRVTLIVAVNVITVLALSSPGGALDSALMHGVQWGLLLVYGGLAYLARLGRTDNGGGAGGRSGFTLGAALRSPEFVVLVVGLALGWWWPAMGIAAAFLLLAHSWEAYLWLLRQNINPGLIFALSFIVLIVGGAAALKLPAATPPEKPISWLDALFTATSAACVTGLAVRDTGTEFTRFGQSIILVLIQLGGLGTTLFGAMVAMLFGSSISLKAVSAMSDATPSGSASPTSMRRLVGFAALTILAIELIGAIVLFLGWPTDWQNPPPGFEDKADRAFHALFFSVSAFCNAGFATSPQGLEMLRLHWTSHVVIAGLIFLGGIGLPVIANVSQIVWAKLGLGGHRRRDASLVRLSLHSRLAIVTTAAVYLAGAALIFAGQWAQRDLAWNVALLDAHFMSVTARTAGFNTTPMSELAPLSRLTIMLSMFVGGSPGSTAGGVKTIAFVIIMLVVWRAIQNREQVEAFGRRITDEIIRKSVVLLVLHLALVLAIGGILLVTEQGRFRPITDNGPFESYMFESVSACSTVGLSMGITAGLSDWGKVAVISGMYLGRVGSLAFLVALAGIAAQRRRRYTYPPEGVVLS